MAVSVLVVDDDASFRDLASRVLTSWGHVVVGEAGVDVVAQAGDADDLLRKTLAHKPDVAIVDVQMPPGNRDDGLRAAIEVRRRLPQCGVLVLSQFYEASYALEIGPVSSEHRRVHAVLTYLRNSRST